MMKRLPGLVAIVVIGLGTGLAGCAASQDTPAVASAGNSGTHSTAAAAPDAGAQKVRFNACMTEHGVNMDDAANAGRSAADSQQMSTAVEACRALLPEGGELAKLSPQDIEKARQYAVCVRAHGVPDYPDPDPATGRSTLTQEQGARLKDDPKLTSATEACRNQAPDGAEPGVNLGGG